MLKQQIHPETSSFACPEAPEPNSHLTRILRRICDMNVKLSDVNNVAGGAIERASGPFPVPGMQADDKPEHGYFGAVEQALDEMEREIERADHHSRLLSSLIG